MTDDDGQWGFSNPGPNTVFVWLEPWADEFEVAARSTLTLAPSGGPESEPLGQMEWTADHLVIWATAQTVAVSIDGVLQHSSSAVIPIPDGLTKQMLGILFANEPSARLTGISSPVIHQSSWWKRVGRRFGL